MNNSAGCNRADTAYRLMNVIANLFHQGRGVGKIIIKQKDMIERPRIIDVVRKPRKCPVCGERVVDIIYGTGDMTEIEFLLEYRREGIMGGDNIPRRPPIWACCCGCKRFRKVNPDGTDAAVKVKMLKDVRRRPAERIHFVSEKK